MAYTPHDPVKVQKIVDLASGLIEQDLTLAKLVTHQAYDQFKGVLGDTLTYRVAGRLPYREYAWRNDRTNPIKFDVYKEGTTTVTWSGHIYSASRVTDEQYEYDLDGWGKLLSAQSNAVATGINTRAAALIEGAPYEVTIAGAGTNIRSALGEARKVLNRFRVPKEARIIVVGSDFEQKMNEDEKLTLAQNVGDMRADNALSDCILGRLYGFTFVADETIDPEAAYAMVPSGFVQLNGAPYVPNSVPFGSTASVGGFAARMMRDYDMDYLHDRSIVDVYVGENVVKDRFLPKEVLTAADPHPAFDPDDLNEYFVRGVKLTLEGAAGDSIYPAVANAAKADLIAETGVSDAKKWTPPAAA